MTQRWVVLRLGQHTHSHNKTLHPHSGNNNCRLGHTLARHNRRVTASQQTPPSKKKAADWPASFNRPRKQYCALATHTTHHTGCDNAHTYVWLLLPTGTVCEALKPTQAPVRLVFCCLLVTHSINTVHALKPGSICVCPQPKPKVCDGRHQHPLGKMIVTNQCTLGSPQHQQPPYNQQFSHSRRAPRHSSITNTTQQQPTIGNDVARACKE